MLSHHRFVICDCTHICCCCFLSDFFKFQVTVLTEAQPSVLAFDFEHFRCKTMLNEFHLSINPPGETRLFKIQYTKTNIKQNPCGEPSDMRDAKKLLQRGKLCFHCIPPFNTSSTNLCAKCNVASTDNTYQVFTVVLL